MENQNEHSEAPEVRTADGSDAEGKRDADRRKSAKGKLHFESMLTRDEAAAYFEAIVKGLRKGSIHFHQAEDSLELAPADHVGIEVKATQKGGREKLSFEVMWRTDKGSELTIVAGDVAPSEERAAS